MDAKEAKKILDSEVWCGGEYKIVNRWILSEAPEFLRNETPFNPIKPHDRDDDFHLYVTSSIRVTEETYYRLTQKKWPTTNCDCDCCKSKYGSVPIIDFQEYWKYINDEWVLIGILLVESQEPEIDHCGNWSAI